VSYAVGGVYSLLARLQCKPNVPRPINPKADLKQQESWKAGGLRDALAEARVTPSSAFGFADEMRVGLRGRIGIRSAAHRRTTTRPWHWT
jgi:hypothetical protein